jgi:NAD(P)-dependent dehydrogenase (short-subunit alcohol dehydrogenase family)
VVDFERRADLLDPAAVEDDEAIGQRHRFQLVVGDVERGGAEAALQALDLAAHGDAQLGVEVGQRLVEQEDGRLADDGAAHGDALALAAGERLRLAVEILPISSMRAASVTRASISAFGVLRFFRPYSRFWRRRSYADRARSSGTPWRYRDRPVLDVVDDAVADLHLPFRDAFKAGDHAQQRGLAAAGGADQDDELAVGEGEGKGGVIINVIGNSGENWDAAYFAGSTGNAALMSFTKALGGRSMDEGIRVVGVNPGPVDTPRMFKIMKRKAIDMLGDESRWEELYDKYPGKRPATAEEVADLCVFLASPKAAYISGTVVTIDGGIAARGSVI